MRRGFLNRPDSRSVHSPNPPNKGAHFPCSRPATVDGDARYALPSVSRRIGSQSNTIDCTPPDERDPIHASMSLLTWGGPAGACDTLFLTFRHNCLALQHHPQADHSLFSWLSLSNACSAAIRPIPGKGLGTFATRDVCPGEVVLRERPLLVMPTTVRRDVLCQLDALLEHMSPERRAAFFGLHNCRPSCLEESNAVGIHRTNSIALPFPSLDRPHAATFDLISRANHSCAPNAVVMLDEESFCGELCALRLIQAAEDRRTLLEEDYRFTCSCAACGMVSGMHGDDWRGVREVRIVTGKQENLDL